MFLPSSVRIAIYINLCSFPISDGWQQKKPLHPPKTHSFRLGVCFLFPMLWSASSAAGFLRRYSEILPGCVLRNQYQGFLSLLFWSSRTAYLQVFGVLSLHLQPLFFCKLYCLHFVLIFILFIFWHSFFLHFFLFLFYSFEVRVSSFIILHQNKHIKWKIWEEKFSVCISIFPFKTYGLSSDFRHNLG